MIAIAAKAVETGILSVFLSPKESIIVKPDPMKRKNPQRAKTISWIMWRNLNRIHTRKYLNFTTYRNGSLITRDDSNNSNESDQEKSNASGNQQVLAVKIKTRNMKHPDIFRKILKSIISNAHQNDADESHDLKLIGKMSKTSKNI